MFGLVRQHGRPGDIAYRIESCDVGTRHAVDDDGAAIGFYPELLEAEILDIADDADGRNKTARFEFLLIAFVVLDRRGDIVRTLFHRRHPRRRDDFDALFLEFFAGEAGDLGILDRSGSAAILRRP